MMLFVDIQVLCILKKYRKHCISANSKSQYTKVYSPKMEPHVRCNFAPVADYDASPKNGAENSPNMLAGNFELYFYLVINITYRSYRCRYQ